jgi:hypothetical protein
MTLRKTLILGALGIAASLLLCGSAGATWVMIEGFDGLDLGPIGGQNEWRAPDAGSTVALDPVDLDNQILSVITESTILSRPMFVPDNETRTVFLRFRYEDQLSVSFGLADATYPYEFSDFKVELSLTSTRDDLRINDGGNYSDLTSLEPEHWFNCWLYIDNAAKVTSVWIHDRPGEGATAADQLAIDGSTEFGFRHISHGMKTFYIKTGGGDGVAGPLLLDDLCIQNGGSLDLSNPTATVAEVTPGPGQMHLDGAWPNPFNPQTTISFTLDESQPVELAVYDVSGRLVRLLEAGVKEAGPHSINWDGRDQAGTGVASGVYLMRLTGPQEALTGKLVLAR